MKARFAAAYVICVLLGFAAVVAFAGQLKTGVHHPRPKPHRAGCVKVGCAQVGDTVTYELHGRVVSVSEPQPGVVCVQTGSSRQAGQICVPK